MKKNKGLLVLPVLSILVLALGATFSYFQVAAMSEEDAVSLQASQLGLSVDIDPLYTGKDLIPMDDTDVMKGYQHACVDDNQFGACQAYEITVTNEGGAATYTGSINFTIADILHLKYMLLDENDNVYLTGTSIVSGTDQTLGNSFALAENTSKTFKLIIWLTNFEYDQNNEDGGGSFSALVTYSNSVGSTVTGSFSNS